MDEGKLIYIADDDYSIREPLKEVLQTEGYRVKDFETGDALLEAFEKKAPDFVITDVMMPGPSGFMVCREIRTFSTVPVILLTSRDTDLDFQIAMEMGGDDFIIKPANPFNILTRVKSIFRRIEFERQKYVGREGEN